MITKKRRIFADDEMNVADVNIDDQASELLFEASDVAELVAEVTQQPVEVTADDDTVVFTVGEDEYTVEADGDEEVLESVRKPLRGKRTVSASTRSRSLHNRRTSPRSVSAGAKVIRRFPKK